MRKRMQKKGFTLIELLIVIGILAILAAIIYVAVDPTTRLQSARDAQRWSEVNSTLNAVLKYTVDQGGSLPTSIDADAATVQMLGENSSATACAAVVCTDQTFPASGCFVDDFDTVLVDTYLAAVPYDPDQDSTTGVDDSRYYINRTASGRITVGACDYEGSDAIEVMR